jgi:hypothetical protein
LKIRSISEKVLTDNAVLAALMSGRKYDLIHQMATVQEKAVCVLRFFKERKGSFIKMQRHYRTQYEKDPTSDNAIRRWLKQFQETGSVLHGRGAGDQALRRKLLIESSKRFLEVYNIN